VRGPLLAPWSPTTSHRTPSASPAPVKRTSRDMEHESEAAV